MPTVEATRWVLEQIDRTKNMSKYYILYVVPPIGVRTDWTEVRHWGRRGTSGRHELFGHDAAPTAMDSASKKAYAELGKGYKQIAHDTFPVPDGTAMTPDALDKAAKKHHATVTEMGLTNSEIDQFTRNAQTLLVALQDPQTGIDIDRVQDVKTRFHAIEEQFRRASATMKMIDLVCSARLEKVGA